MTPRPPALGTFPKERSSTVNEYTVLDVINKKVIGRFSVEGNTIRARSENFPLGLKGHLERLLAGGSADALERYVRSPAAYTAGYVFRLGSVI